MSNHKILIENHHGLGDVVHMIPMIQNLRRAYPDSSIFVIVASEAHAALLRSTGLVDGFYFLNLGNMTIRQILAFIRMIRKEQFDMGFTAVGTNKKLGLALLFLLGCKCKIIEYDKKLIFNYNILQTEEKKELHRVIRNLNLLKPIHVEINEDKPFLKIDHTTAAVIKEKIKLPDNNKLIGLCVGTNPSIKKIGFKKICLDAKQWGMGKFIDLADKLMEDKYDVILIGGKKEEAEIQPYLKKVKDNPRLINFINSATIMESAALAGKCELVIGCDTGIMHIADALGVKTLTIFGPTNPKLYGAYSDKAEYLTLNIECQYCHGTVKLVECTDRICLSNITVQQVYGKAREILNEELKR